MKNIYEELEELVTGGETVATATVVHTEGSTPRQVGAKMIVRPSGETIGSVGGGLVEARARRGAMRAIRAGDRRAMEVELLGDFDSDTDMVCGGLMNIFIDLWNQEEVEFVEAVNRGFEESKKVAIATTLSTDQGRPRMLVLADGRTVGSLGDETTDAWVTSEAVGALSQGTSRTVDEPETGRELFIEVHLAPPTLLIVGAGHIAVPLVRLATMLGFRVVVLDDRPAFANRERFPEADEVMAGDFGETLGSYPLDERTYVAIMTRGHSHDVECLLQVIEAPVAYIGMVGSRRRVRGVFEVVKRAGHSEESLARVHAPIGLDIGAQAPEEIALSIAAQIVQARRGGGGGSLSKT